MDGRIVFVRCAHQVSYNAPNQREKGVRMRSVMISVRAARHAPKIRSCTEPVPPCVCASFVNSRSRAASAVSITRVSVLADLGKVARRHEEKQQSDREVGELATPAMQ